MTDAEIDALVHRAAQPAGMHPLGRVGLEVAEKLAAEVRRLRPKAVSDRDLLQAEADAALFDAVLLDANATPGVDRLVLKLTNEIRRLRRGDFTPEEFQALCHHRDDKPGCTRADFEAGCVAYQEKLFGPKHDDMTAAQYRVLHDEPHPSHVWNASILDQCIRCGEYRSSRHAWFACDPKKLADKVEFCCECAGEYPAGDLIAGHIYCPKCRRPDGAPCA